MSKINSDNRKLSAAQQEELVSTLKARFEKNMNRHKDLAWYNVRAKLEAKTEKRWSLSEMERTGGEPDVVGYDKKAGEYIFYDCSAESPKESYYYQFIGIDKSNGDTVRILTPCQTADLNLKPNVGSYTP